MKKSNFNKKAKRAISAVTAFVMFSGFLPLEELPHGIRFFNFEKKITAYAVSNTSPDIKSHQQLVDYSLAYKEYPGHQNDTIEIAYQTGDETTLLTGFESIGTAEKPFAGKIIINSNSVCNFNLDTAFFDYVYDYVTIEVQGTNRVFTINTEADNTNGAIFANHVVHDDRTGITYDPAAEANNPSLTLVETAEWNIKVEDSVDAPNASPPRSSAPHAHSSLIGEMGEDAELTVSIVNNSKSSFSSSSGNVGTICGTMKERSKLTVSSVTGNNKPVSTASGNAGGLVGEMEPGSTLTVNSLPATASVTANGYAGGLVGKNDRATVEIDSAAPSISNTVSGTSGAGGLFGYYKPIMDSKSEYSLNLDDFQIGTSGARCTVTSTNGAGGFFGVLDNPGGTITLNGSSSKTIYVQNSGASTVFGGIIGKYQATGITDTLNINGTGTATPITVNTTRTGDIAAYGGIIGKIDDAYFASITDVDVTAADSDDWTFGGAVAIANSGYVYVNNLKLNTSGSNAHGGGVVGNCANGVVHLAGSTNFSSAKFEAGSSNYGQIVGYRDSALVFADSTWNLTRNGTTNAVDDIGSWGEVVRFKDSDFTIGSVLDSYYDASATTPLHYATVKAATFDNSSPTKISIGSKSTFATAALNMQLNNDTSSSTDTNNTKVLRFADVTNSTYNVLKAKSVVLTADVDLHHTGMTGLTRDNGSNYQYTGAGIDAEYTDNGTAKKHKLTLAIGEYYTGNDTTSNTDSSGAGMIYTHRFNGLFGETTSAFTAENIIISGEVYTKDRAGDEKNYYVGTIAGNATDTFTVQNVTVDSDTKIKFATNGSKDILYVGGLVGKMSAAAAIGSTTYSGTTDSIFSASITGSASEGNAYIGGVCGYVDVATGSINVHDVIITNEVSNSGTSDAQQIGGLFAAIADHSNTLDLNGVELNGLTVKGKMSSDGSMGGLLGYSWDGVNATFDNITVSSCTLNNDSSSGNQAAVVYTGSGHWQFKEVNINGLTLTGSAASSLGMLVNKAYSGSKAMYLELPSEFTYTIQNVTGTAPSIYDELAVYTVMPDNTIEANGNSVISINTNGTTKYGPMTAAEDTTNTDHTKVHMTLGKCNTYQNQVTTTGFSNYNPNSRYYYNIDNYIGKSNTGTAALYLWSVYQYAHSTIQSKIASSAPTATFLGNLDLDGYSYYPVDISGTVNIQGNVKLCNEAIETIEGNEAANKGDNYARSTLSGTQHYLMHAGLFRNVSGTININGALSIAGTVPDVETYCGAVICGTISGSTENDAKISSQNGSILLNGIKIWNYTAPAENSEDHSYAPLLINKADSCVVLDIYNVSADSSEYDLGATIATSLLGDIGTETARRVQVTFRYITLDGRTPANSTESALSAYGTSHSLFRNATLLESLSYAPSTGSFGNYNYTYSEDWGQTNSSDNRNVTYGFEISDSNSTNFQKEFWYFGEDISSSAANYTHALSGTYQGNSTSEYYDFSGFRPYVYISGDKINNSSLQHQLDINHATASFSGCGTYNHPYTFAATTSDLSGGLSTIEKILNNRGISGDTTIKLNLPNSLDAKWCGNTKTDCHEYNFDGNDTFSYEYEENGETKTKTRTLTDVRTYLAGAYYYVSTDIVIDDTNFPGLGSNSNDYAVFHGVIIGNNTLITNKSASPLIAASNGSVVKNLTVKVMKSSLAVNGAKSDFDQSTGCGAYGAVIGKVFGGDNIIDQVGVQFDSTTKIALSGTQYLAPVGGYIGVVVAGGVIFKNMNLVPAANRVGLVDSNFSAAGKIGDSNTAFLYCNPIIGRVINGYAVNESDAYRPFEDGTRTYGDGSKDYWKSDGAIVTKTKAELDADSTLDSTMKASAVGVTMKNGNKNYSITDIDPDPNSNSEIVDMLDITSGNAISIPNSQAFFIMSLIVNSGMGSKTTPAIGYYGTNQVNRHAEYRYVDTDIELTETSTEAYEDYQKALADSNSARLPYLIENYTNAYSGTYYAQFLGENTYTLSLGADIQLPDGYKGIGNFYQNNDNLRLALSLFDGKTNSTSHTIVQNTTNNSYNPNTLDNYAPSYAATYLNSNIEQYYSSASGFGLFNVQTQYGNYKNFTLKGNVKSKVYTDKGAEIEYTPNVANKNANTRIQAVGSLFGTISYHTTSGDAINITDVSLNNIDVFSAKHAGGMIGFIPLNEAYNGSWDNKVINITNNVSSEKINVTAGLDAGGLIGFFYMGNVNINYNNYHFDITKIESLCKNIDGGYEYDHGCGGIVGVMRCNSAGKTTDTGISSNTARIENIIIGKDDKTYAGTVEASSFYNSSKTPIYIGGVFGILNRSPLVVNNINVYNVSTIGCSYTGGMVGWAGTESQTTIINSSLFTNNDAKISNTDTSKKGQTGGFIGYCKSDMKDFTLISCSIENYTIEHCNTSGGVLGGWATNSPFSIKNFEIIGCIIKGDTSVGGIAGELSKPLKGYNVFEKNISLKKYTGTGYPSNYGCVVGKMNSGGVITIVGFSRQDDQSTSTMVDKVTGNNSYGTNGYVIFADYDGICDEQEHNTSFAELNNTSNVSGKVVITMKDVLEVQDSNGQVKRNRNYTTSVSSGSSELATGKKIVKQVVTKSGSTWTIVETTINSDGTTTEETKTSNKNPSPYGWTDGRTVTITTTTIVIDGSQSPYVTMNPSITLDSGIGLLTGDGISAEAVTNIITDMTGSSAKRYHQAKNDDNSSVYTSFWNSTDSAINSDVISSFDAELGDVIKTKPYGSMPLLVVNDTSTADTVVNNYLRALTNTNIDFSNDVANQTYGSVNNSTDIGTVTIQKCAYNNGVYALTDDACLTITGGEFVIRTVTNNNIAQEQYDTANPNGQFTLIDVAFKDPANTSEIAYHLYVPVLVKKLLEYRFDISVLSGSTYDMSKYTPDVQRGKALVENLGTPITFEFEYEYLRNLSEWSSEVANYHYDKKLQFSNTGGFNFGQKTKAMLIDMNDGGKAYYLNRWTDGFSGNELDLQSFIAADGTTHFKAKDFNTLISTQGSVDDNKNIKEKYYLTIFTEPPSRANETETILAHYIIQSKAFTDDTEHPSRRVNCEGQNSGQPHNSVHLIIGDFYTNNLTVTTTTTQPKMYANNKQINVNLSTNLSIVNEATKGEIIAYLTHDDVQLFQSFLLYFEKREAGTPGEKGISAIDECTANISIVKSDNSTITTNDNIVISRSHIELQNNTDISNALAGGTVTITANAVMEFNDDETRNLQFPKWNESGSPNTGALVWGASNLSSQNENTAYSAVSKADHDTVGTLFYRTSEDSALLNYYANYDIKAQLQGGEDAKTKRDMHLQRDEQLGVNGREVELDTDNNGASKVYTEARYDVSQLPDADSIKYIKCEVELEQKNDPNNPESYITVPINNYLTGLTVCGLYQTDQTSTTTKLVFILNVDQNQVQKFLNEEDVYKIPIEFNVKTGKNSDFETSQYVYANYKIKLTVSAFDHNAASDTDGSDEPIPWQNYITNSKPNADFVIYTNARIYTDLIKQAS